MEQRAYLRALARVYEEGHCFSNEVPEVYMEEARGEVASLECAEKLKQIEILQKMIDITYATFDAQVLGLAMNKAVHAMKQKEHEMK